MNKLLFGSLLFVSGMAWAQAGSPPLQAQVQFQKGRVYLRTQEYVKAIQAFTAAIQLHPDFAEAYHQRGSAYYYQGSHEAACPDWEKACQLDQACLGWDFGLYQKVCIAGATPATKD